jgi:hypothetical protein
MPAPAAAALPLPLLQRRRLVMAWQLLLPGLAALQVGL